MNISKAAIKNLKIKHGRYRKKKEIWNIKLKISVERWREFYKTTIDDLFKDVLEKSQLWFADNKPHEKPKCDKCDADRKWVLIWPDGTTLSKQCTCAQPDYWYEPEETWIDYIRYIIKDSDYQSERYYRLDAKYQCTGESRWNDYSYSDFGVQFVYDKFCDDTIEKYKQLNYSKHIGFTSKEECQKYCDWLNAQRNTKDKEDE